ncbi:MAG: YhcN/YlaJ family sporulation lipoprotein [Epulopiscium sp.]|nr:YhcN/YlaJ family sporulation lipoprotein [Candidatus Epulonipiscium sp.]
MSKNKYIFNYIAMFVLVLSGCTNIKNYIGKDMIKTKGSIEEFNNPNPYNTPEEVERRTNTYFDMEYNTQRANRIAEKIARLPEVEKTTVVITGNTALIGLSLGTNTGEEQVNQIKKKVEKETFLMDASLKNISITSSPEIVERIIDISKGINKGRPINGLSEELGAIIRRVTPTV